MHGKKGSEESRAAQMRGGAEAEHSRTVAPPAGREMGSRLDHELDVQFVMGETLIGENSHYF